MRVLPTLHIEAGKTFDGFAFGEILIIFGF
jgi:hypothetical protein